MQMRILDDKYFLIENTSLIIENETLSTTNETSDPTKLQSQIQTYFEKRISVFRFDINYYVFSDLQDPSSTFRQMDLLKKLIKKETQHTIKSVTHD